MRTFQYKKSTIDAFIFINHLPIINLHNIFFYKINSILKFSSLKKVQFSVKFVAKNCCKEVSIAF